MLTVLFQSTMLLNANIAFLAIPNISTSGQTALSPAQICSALSIIASIGSIIISLMLIRSNHSKVEMEAIQAVCVQIISL